MADTSTPPRWKRLLREIPFYGGLILLILGALMLRLTGDGAPRLLGGYSGMIVLTGSMEPELPQGSLVITHAVDPAALRVGDDITYMASATVSVTHRIEAISRDEDGGLLFETQGISNTLRDREKVPEANLVGKVVFHSLALGTLALFIKDWWPVLLLAVGVGIVLVHVLRKIAAGPQS